MQPGGWQGHSRDSQDCADQHRGPLVHHTPRTAAIRAAIGGTVANTVRDEKHDKGTGTVYARMEELRLTVLAVFISAVGAVAAVSLRGPSVAGRRDERHTRDDPARRMPSAIAGWQIAKPIFHSFRIAVRKQQGRDAAGTQHCAENRDTGN